jgi:phage-related minor tail protein
MASGKIRGITVEIGGDTTKLGKALQSVETKTRSLEKELRGVESLLKMDPGNTELLAQKQQILTEAVSETSEKLKILENAEKQVIAQFEKGDIGIDQLRDFQREIIATEQKLDGFKSELKSLDSAADMSGTVSELDKLTSKINDQETELSQLKDRYTEVDLEQGRSSDEARELAEKMTALNDELKENKQKLNDAEEAAREYADALDEVDDSSEDASGGFTIMGGALADLVSSAIQGAISAIGDLIDSILELSEATEEYRTMQSKLEGSANTFGYSADFAKGKYEEFYKYLGDDQAATNAITNLMGLGTSTENLSSLAEGAIGVWASYGDSIPIESLTESINVCRL